MVQRTRPAKRTQEVTNRSVEPTQKVTKRDADHALRAALTPLLRARGFQGKFPHFQLAQPDGEAWVVSVQHDKYGGGFRAELAWVPPQRLFPRLDSSPSKDVSTLKAWSVGTDFREIVPHITGFVRYELDLARATKRVVAAVDRAVPGWFEANRAIASRLGPKTSAATLRRLRGEAGWVALWIEANVKALKQPV